MNTPSGNNLSVGGKGNLLGGWDEQIFQGLSSQNKKAYALAARLHHNVFRKDGQAYLVHINRSLAFLESHRDFQFEGVSIETLVLYIILHDCIEDHQKGLEMIQKYFGNEVAISVLWMSAPKVDVLQQLQTFLHDHQQEISLDSYAVFQGVSAIIQKNNPEDPSTIEDLKRIFPQGEWISLWKDGFQKRYETAESISKKKNVFADWVFQGMVYNMPKGEFIAKSFERLDNLTDVTGLQDEKGMTSYQKTIFTTKNTYLIRLKNLSIYPLISVMNLALDANNPYIKKITHDVKSRVNIPSTGGE